MNLTDLAFAIGPMIGGSKITGVLLFVLAGLAIYYAVDKAATALHYEMFTRD